MTDLPSLAAVVFDLDGLIVNSEDVYEQADVEVLRRRGKVYDAELRAKMMGRPTAESLRTMIEWHALDDTVDFLEAERSLLRDKLLETSLDAMPGLHALLQALELADIPKCIATSGHRSYAADVLGRLDLHTRFEFVLTSEDVAHGKPAPDVYQLAATRLGLRPSETMVLEDSVNGCIAGVAAGAFTVAVPNRHTRDYEFAGVAFVADTLADPRIRRALGIAPDSTAAPCTRPVV
jgi:HAD superfamily hydrolase (TIGR01509 family)